MQVGLELLQELQQDVAVNVFIDLSGEIYLEGNANRCLVEEESTCKPCVLQTGSTVDLGAGADSSTVSGKALVCIH